MKNPRVFDPRDSTSPATTPDLGLRRSSGSSGSVPGSADQVASPKRTAAPRWTRSAKLHVRAASRPGVVFVVPMANVLHAPRAKDGTRLKLCPWYDRPHDFETARCPSAERCPYVHVDLRGAIEYTPHERDADWRSLGDVPYPRFPAGTLLVLAKPNRNEPAEAVDSGFALRTRALESDRRPLSHCAHYLLKGICHRGSKCYFVHLVRLPAAAPPADAMPIHDPTLTSLGRPVVGHALPRVVVGRRPTELDASEHPRVVSPVTPALVSREVPEDPPSHVRWHNPYAAAPSSFQVAGHGAAVTPPTELGSASVTTYSRR